MDKSPKYKADAAGALPDQQWLEAIARQYTVALNRFFERRLRDSADAPDLVQEVFVRLSQVKETDAIHSPERYIFKTASNTLLDHHRRGVTRRVKDQIEFDAEIHGGSDFSPELVLEHRQTLLALEEALRALPERTRDVFVLRALEGQKTNDVAQALGISTRAVEKHYAKAAERVARALRPYRD